jgi:RNase P/RNase MRP subunit p29
MTVKTLKTLLVVGVVLSLAGIALSEAPKEAPKDRPARPRGLFGTLVKVDGTNLVIKTRARGSEEAKEVTVATNDKTEFVVDGEAGKLADLKAEMRVYVTPETGTAEKVRATNKGLEGAVVKVDGKNVIVKTRGPDAKEVTVATDEKTKVIIDEKVCKLEDLKAEMRVTVIPETGTAAKIIAMAGGGRRPGGEAPKEPPKEGGK